MKHFFFILLCYNFITTNLLKNMDIEELKVKKRSGDFVIASFMLELPQPVVQMSFRRPGSKHHEKVKEALTKIILSREEQLSV